MPYTPPSQQSPASTRSPSPTLSKSPAQFRDNGPRSPSVGRPSPPRSLASSSYLRKHRRSPSVSRSDAGPPTPTETSDPLSEPTVVVNGATASRPSSPGHNLIMSTGAILSPPDSSENSDGDNEGRSGQARASEWNMSWEELQQAVRAIDQKRDLSPDKSHASYHTQHTSAPTFQGRAPPALSAEARKISHSRSSTETALLIPPSHFPDAVTTSSDSDEEDDPALKPSLVRKKSGELVKPALRPSSRRRYSSMPGTPTYSKSVHFNDSGNQTRHFLQVDKPIAVSAGTSPTTESYELDNEFPFAEQKKPEREMRLRNFPGDSVDRKAKLVRVERIFLTEDKQTLVGVVAVHNLAFQKMVVARFTLDSWQTTSEVLAEYSSDSNRQNDSLDRFNFQIKLSDHVNIDNKSLLLCVRYIVGGQEIWDNNNGANYQIDFTKAAQAPSKSTASTNGLGSRPLNALPRSRHLPPAPSRGRSESLDDDFASGFGNGPSYSFGSSENLLGESGGSIKLKPRGGRGSVFPTTSGTQSANGLGGRYDFGASLSAALSTAQDTLGRESGLMKSTQKARGGSYFGPLARTEGPSKVQERPDAMLTVDHDRPAIGSDQYKDLVQKFCYVGSANNHFPHSAEFTPASTAGKTPPPQPQQPESRPRLVTGPTGTTTGTAADNDSPHDSARSSVSSSGSSSPERTFDGSNERMLPTLPRTSFVSSSPSASATGSGKGSRSTSPMTFGYPFHTPPNYLGESSTPTAIRG